VVAIKNRKNSGALIIAQTAFPGDQTVGLSFRKKRKEHERVSIAATRLF